jgi:hypothetical protein
LRALALKHLSQAGSYLLAATDARKNGLKNPAVSLAVHAVILAKDAYCLAVAGSSRKARDHHAAITELQQAGGVPVAQLNQIRALLASKNSAEYEAEEFSDAKCDKLLSQAERFCAFVENTLSARAN